jgi:hypothetical protein
MNYIQDRGHASTAEVLECFLGEQLFLSQLAFLITGDQASADQSVVNACEMTVKGHGPFRDWLLEWAKAATITSAISQCAETIRDCEAGYKDQVCSHMEHTSQADAEQRTAQLNLLLKTDTLNVFEELDALSRAVLVLRLAMRSSIQDCVLRLNVGRATVLAANCRAMKWLDELQSQPVPETQPGSSASGRHDETRPLPGRDRGNGNIRGQLPMEVCSSGFKS